MGDPPYTIVQLKKYLSVPEMPVSNEEFTKFWSSLTEAEKMEYKNTPLR